MNSKCLCFSSLLVLSALSTVACEPPLPEAYGIYARQGYRLVNLTDNNTDDDWNLPTGSEIIVFDRELTSPFFSLTDHLHLYRTAYSRSEEVIELHLDPTAAQALLNRGPNGVALEEVVGLPIRNRSTVSKANWITIGGPIGVSYEPVPDRQDTIVVIPTTKLDEGTYTLVRETSTGTQNVSFGIGLSPDARQRQSATCVDEYLYAVEKPEGFQGWDQWFTDVSNWDKEMNRRRANGIPVVAETVRPCGEADHDSESSSSGR